MNKLLCTRLALMATSLVSPEYAFVLVVQACSIQWLAYVVTSLSLFTVR